MLWMVEGKRNNFLDFCAIELRMMKLEMDERGPHIYTLRSFSAWHVAITQLAGSSRLALSWSHQECSHHHSRPLRTIELRPHCPFTSVGNIDQGSRRHSFMYLAEPLIIRAHKCLGLGFFLS